MNDIVFYALLATLGTWLVTALGAATVVLFKSPNPKILNLMLGFAAGVMVAASFWSLLQPAIERAEAAGSMPAFLVATLGFLCGALFMWGSDKCVTYAQRRSALAQGEKNARLNRIILLVLSITLHNIPEGLAVGVAFGALKNGGYTPEALMGAVTVAVGIGLQNFPEGAAVSLPLRREGCSDCFFRFSFCLSYFLNCLGLGATCFPLRIGDPLKQLRIFGLRQNYMSTLWIGLATRNFPVTHHCLFYKLAHGSAPPYSPRI